MFTSSTFLPPSTGAYDLGSTTRNWNNFYASGAVTLSGGTANGVGYLNGSKVLTTGSALTFDGTNLGLGVTPSAWSAFKPALELGTVGNAIAGNGTNYLNLFANAYFNSGYKYANNGYANMYVCGGSSGVHQWYNAPSGTAGNAITFTQAMTLDASGNLLVGGTTTAGSTGNVTTIAGGIFKTASGSVSTPNATATTLATLLNQGQAVYMVTAGIPAAGGPALYSTVALVSTQGTATNLTTIQTGANVVLSMSGLNLQVTQTAGSTFNIAWTVIRVA